MNEAEEEEDTRGRKRERALQVHSAFFKTSAKIHILLLQICVEQASHTEPLDKCAGNNYGMFQASSAWLGVKVHHQAVLILNQIFRSVLCTRDLISIYFSSCSTAKPSGLTSLDNNIRLINAASNQECSQAKTRFVKSPTASLTCSAKTQACEVSVRARVISRQ